MLSLKEKISLLEKQLKKNEENYSDNFKTDILVLFGDFNVSNPNFKFLNNLNSKEEITNWLNKLTSRIVMKFDEETETINDFIHDYIELG